MFSAMARDQQIKEFIDSAMRGESDNFKRRLLSVLSRLSESEWIFLEEKLRELLDGAAPHPDGDGARDSASAGCGDSVKTVSLPRAKKRHGMVEIRVYDQPAAAGLGNYLDDPDYHIEQYPETVIPEDTDFGIIISGNSMEPKVHDGGTAFVQAAPVIDEGKIGIFVLNGESYCKQLRVDHESQQIRLVSLNKQYADIIVRRSDHFRTVGRVLGQWTKGHPQDHYGW